MFGPEPPQGFTTEQGQVIINRRPIPLFEPPQRIRRPPTANDMAYEDLEVMGYEPADWFNALWQQRIALTINASQVPSTITDVPLLINDTYPDLIGEVEAELRFTGEDHVQLDYEIELFDNSTGELVAWAKKPSVNTGDKVIIYFDNPAAVDEQNPFAVWSDYSNVYHLNNDPTPSFSILDSTIAQESGDPVSTALVAGKIGDGQDFVEPTDRILLPRYNVNFSFSISIWFETTLSNRCVVVSVTDASELNAVFTEVRADGALRYVYRNPPSGGGGVDINTGAFTVNDGLFHKAVFIYDDAGDNQEIFVDGVSRASTTNTLAPQDAATMNSLLGDNVPSMLQFPFEGTMDEFQTYVGVLSADRIETEFNNQNSQSTFYSTGTVEQVPTTFTEMEYEE